MTVFCFVLNTLLFLDNKKGLYSHRLGYILHLPYIAIHFLDTDVLCFELIFAEGMQCEKQSQLPESEVVHLQAMNQYLGLLQLLTVTTVMFIILVLHDKPANPMYYSSV